MAPTPHTIKKPAPYLVHADEIMTAVVGEANGIIAQLSAQNDKITEQNKELREALQRIARHVGGAVGEACSHEFHCMVADEVKAFLDATKLRDTEKALSRTTEALALAQDQIRKLVGIDGLNYMNQFEEERAAYKKWSAPARDLLKDAVNAMDDADLGWEALHDRISAQIKSFPVFPQRPSTPTGRGT